MKRLENRVLSSQRITAYLIVIFFWLMGHVEIMAQESEGLENEVDSLRLILNDLDINNPQFLATYDKLRTNLKNNGSNRKLVDLSLDVLTNYTLSKPSNSLVRSKAYTDISNSYRGLGKIDSAAYYATAFNLFLDEVEEKNELQGYVLLNERLWALKVLGVSYGEKGNIDKCLSALDTAIELIENTNVTDALGEYPEFRYGHVYTTYAIICENLGKFQESDIAYLKASEEAETLGDLRSLAEAKFFYARSLARRRIPNMNLVVDLVHEIDVTVLSRSGLVTPWNVYGLFTTLYDPVRLNIPDSVKYYSNKALESVLQTDDYSQIAGMYWGTVISARALKDWHWAYVNYELMAGYDMQILRSSNERNIGRLENQLKSERDKIALEAEVALQRNRKMMWILAGLALVIINVLALRSLMLNKKTRRLEHLQQSKLQSDMELEELKKDKLRRILEFKNRQLATSTLSKGHMNSQMNSIMEKLMEIEKMQDSTTASSQLGKVIKSIKSTNNLKKNWEQFYKHFESVHPNFFHRLLEVNDDLTQNELRHSAYVLMKLSNKEVAHMYGISHQSVKKARWRLKSRLNLGSADSLQDFIYRIANQDMHRSYVNA